MYKKKKILTLILGFAVLLLPIAIAGKTGKKGDKAPKGEGEITATGTPVLWREPTDIASRSLLYGSGGEQHQPSGNFTFVEEDLEGSNPKFVVKDDAGVKWKVKLGSEAKPEVVASRLVWAVGYFANEDYYVPELTVKDMPARLKRKHADNFIRADGTIPDARLKRHADEKKIGGWQWRNNPFNGTRELNGLRVMMALINNWDLKDVNNVIYKEKHSSKKEKGGSDDQKPSADDETNTPEKGGELIYLISDLGSSFGTTRLEKSHEKAKGNLNSYEHSKFVKRVEGDFVDFADPSRPTILAAVNPHEFMSRVNMEWIGKHIPRADAKWIGQLLAQLSREQIRDAFRAAGYAPEQVEAFAGIIESRIAELNQL